MMTAKIVIPQTQIVPNDKVLLLQMLDAAREALSFCEGYTRSALDTNRILLLALIEEIEIIGGTAERVSEIIKFQLPQSPWPAIVDMRNHLLHSYFDIDVDQVWSTVQQDLPPLITELQKVVFDDRAE